MPENVRRLSGIQVAPRSKPYANPGYFQIRMRYAGPVGRGTAKVEVSTEGFLGPVKDAPVPATLDCPAFAVRAYTVETILAEKMRSIIQRGHIRDYYDVWKLLGKNPDKSSAEIFLKKCRAAGVVYSGTKQFFPEGVEDNLKAYAEIGLARFTGSDTPAVKEMLSELRDLLEKFLAF